MLIAIFFTLALGGTILAAALIHIRANRANPRSAALRQHRRAPSLYPDHAKRHGVRLPSGAFLSLPSIGSAKEGPRIPRFASSHPGPIPREMLNPNSRLRHAVRRSILLKLQNDPRLRSGSGLSTINSPTIN